MVDRHQAGWLAPCARTEILRAGGKRLPIRHWVGLLLVWLVLIEGSSGTTITAEQSLTVAHNWLTEYVERHGGWAGESRPEIIRSHQLMSNDGGTILAWQYDIWPQGFVVVNVLKELTPIMVFSELSALDSRQQRGILQMIEETQSARLEWFSEVYGHLEAAPSSSGVLYGRTAMEWDRLSVDPKHFATAAVAPTDLQVGPLLTSRWSQYGPYNGNCPVGYAGEQCVVGCVVLATAQILNYWQWPPHGLDQYTYYWWGDRSCDSSTPDGYLSGDLTDSFDWANMLDDCTSGCTGAEQAAVAELCYEAGVTMKTQYGVCASAAFHQGGAIESFTDKLCYRQGITIERRADNALEDWFALIVNEIDAGRPIQYEQSAHALVCDGYAEMGESKYIHVNYGWDGAWDGWYAVDQLYCCDCPGFLSPPDQELIMFPIEPQTDPRIRCAGYSIDDSASDGDGVAEAGETISLTLAARNHGWNAVGVTAQLVSLDTAVSVLASETSFPDTVLWNGLSLASFPVTIEISSGCNYPYYASLALHLYASGGYMDVDTIVLTIGDVPGFFDNVEAGEGSWVHYSPTVGYVDEWHISDFRAVSSTHSWKVGGPGGGDYSKYNDSYLLSPPFLLAAGSSLQFWHRMDAQGSGSDTLAAEGGVVMISTSADDMWTQIEPEGGYPMRLLFHNTLLFDHLTPCFSGSFDWKQESFDLSDYSGVVQLMFRFSSDASQEYEGWYIDDIEVSGCCGRYTGGYTGNTNCSTDGRRNLSDITRLIDHVYIGQEPLCCSANGNASGDEEGRINLSDITVLIDHVYINQQETAACE